MMSLGVRMLVRWYWLMLSTWILKFLLIEVDDVNVIDGLIWVICGTHIIGVAVISEKNGIRAWLNRRYVTIERKRNKKKRKRKIEGSLRIVTVNISWLLT